MAQYTVAYARHLDTGITSLTRDSSQARHQRDGRCVGDFELEGFQPPRLGVGSDGKSVRSKSPLRRSSVHGWTKSSTIADAPGHARTSDLASEYAASELDSRSSESTHRRPGTRRCLIPSSLQRSAANELGASVAAAVKSTPQAATVELTAGSYAARFLAAFKPRSCLVPQARVFPVPLDEGAVLGFRTTRPAQL